MKISILKGSEIINSGLDDQLISLDRLHMEPILRSAGLDFPEEKRRLALLNNPVIILATDAHKVAGYLEYQRSWNNPENIYISSIQIDKKYRNTRLILQLIDNFISAVSGESFTGFETGVQKNNLPAIRIYRKIGFKLEENPNNPASFAATAEKSLLKNSPVLALLEKWREKKERQGKS